MDARQIHRNYLQRTLTRNTETLYSSEYHYIINIANAHETVNGLTADAAYKRHTNMGRMRHLFHGGLLSLNAWKLGPMPQNIEVVA